MPYFLLITLKYAWKRAEIIKHANSFPSSQVKLLLYLYPIPSTILLVQERRIFSFLSLPYTVSVPCGFVFSLGVHTYTYAKTTAWFHPFVWLQLLHNDLGEWKTQELKLHFQLSARHTTLFLGRCLRLELVLLFSSKEIGLCTCVFVCTSLIRWKWINQPVLMQE